MSPHKNIIIGIGEVLVDRFPEYTKPGGAPANVVYNLNKLGNNGIIVSSVGDDEAGKMLCDFLKEQEIPTKYVQQSAKPTGMVDVTFDGDEAHYHIVRNVAWDDIRWSEDLLQLAQQCDAICFSTLSQRDATTAETIHKFLDAARPDALKVLDINLRPPYTDKEMLAASFQRADLIKLNEHEYHMVAEVFGVAETSTFLFETYGVKAIILTLGSKGSKFITPDALFEGKSKPVDTSKGDSVGVGDAFIASIIHHMLKGTDPQDMLVKANQFAGFVATQPGAMVKFSTQLLEQTT